MEFTLDSNIESLDETIFHYSHTRNSTKLESVLLLRPGIDVNKVRDRTGSNPLHILFSKECLSEKCQHEAMQCARLLIRAGIDVNLVNKEGDVPLYLALKNNWSQAARELALNGTADLTIRLKSKQLLATYLANTRPDILCQLLDQDVKVEIGSDGSVDKLIVDFRNVIQFPKSAVVEPDKNIRCDETAFLQSIVETARGTEIFQHPVLLLFIGLKYHKLQPMILFSFVWHALTIVLYTTYIYTVYVLQCPFKIDHDDDGSTTASTTTAQPLEEDFCSIPISLKVISGVLTAVWVLMLLTELQIFITQGRRSYFTKRTIPWYIFYILMPITLWPSLGSADGILKWRYPVAAVNIFLIWALCIIHFAKIQRLAVIFEMFTKVTLKVFSLALFFIPLFVGFSISFFVLDANNIDSPYSLITIVSMMIGDTAYGDLFKDDRGSSIVYESLSNLLYLMFILLMSIVFVNFILALTISDIKELWDECEKSRTKNQIQLMYIFDRLRVSRIKLFGREQIIRKQLEYRLPLTNSPGFINKRVLEGLKQLVFKKEDCCGHSSFPQDYSYDSTKSSTQIPRASLRATESTNSNVQQGSQFSQPESTLNEGEEKVLYEATKILERILLQQKLQSQKK